MKSEPELESDKEKKAAEFKDELEALKGLYTIREVGTLTKAKFGGSFLYTQFRLMNFANHRWDKVGDHLYLGEIPSANDIPQIKNLVRHNGDKLGLVVSVIDYFEYAGKGVWFNVATHEDWSKHNIDHLLLPMEDFGSTVPLFAISHVILKIRECILSDKAVLLHCKAGVGRSAMLSAIYLSIYGAEGMSLEPGKDLEEVLLFLQGKRRQVKLEPDKKDKVKYAVSEIVKRNDIAKMAKQSDVSASPIPLANELKKGEGKQLTLDPLIPKMRELLRANLAKYEIANLTSFKSLGLYAASHSGSMRQGHIQKFFNLILSSREGWFSDLYGEKRGPMRELRCAVPVINLGRGSDAAAEDKKKRNDLVDQFKKELLNYFEEKLKLQKGILSNEAIRTMKDPLYSEKIESMKKDTSRISLGLSPVKHLPSYNGRRRILSDLFHRLEKTPQSPQTPKFKSALASTPPLASPEPGMKSN